MATAFVRMQASKLAHQLAARVGQELPEDRSEQTSWLSYCPAHDNTETPALSITASDKVVFSCKAGCDQKELVSKIKELGLFPGGDKVSPGKQSYKVLDTIPEELIIGYTQYDGEVNLIEKQRVTNGKTDYAVDVVYYYDNEEGQLAFAILRVNAGNNYDKIIRPLVAVEYPDGHKALKQVGYKKQRPVYNLGEVLSRDKDPILLVEGEKTVEAAKKLFPDYVVTTWSGGAQGIRHTNWVHLKNRTILAWPDNDMASIKAMRQIINLIGEFTELPKLVFTEPFDLLPKGWDLADPLPDELPDYSVILEDATQLTEEDIKPAPPQAINENLDNVYAYFNDKYVRLLQGASTIYVNVKDFHPNTLNKPFLEYTKATLPDAEPGKVYVETANGRMAEAKKADLWIENGVGDVCYGYMYNPGTSDRIVTEFGRRYINTFIGFAGKPRQNDDLIAHWLEHIAQSTSPVNAEFLHNFIAHMVQYPMRPPEIILILKGPQGSGKSVICETITAMLGYSNAIPSSPRQILGNFNALIANKLFIYADEFSLGNRDQAELIAKLNEYATGSLTVIEKKGVDATLEVANKRIVLNSNADVPFSIAPGSRRYAFIQINNHRVKRNNLNIIDDPDYFRPLKESLINQDYIDALMYYYMSRKVKVQLDRPPETEEYYSVVELVDPVDRFMHTIINEGIVPETKEYALENNDFKKGTVFVPSWYMRNLLTENNVVSDVHSNKVSRQLNRYLKHDAVNSYATPTVITKRNGAHEKKQVSCFKFDMIELQRKKFSDVTGYTNWHKLPERTDDTVVPLRKVDSEDVI